MAKIICPDHNDSTPSMEIYQNGDETIGYCFVCQSRRVFNNPESLGVKLEKTKKLPTSIPNMLSYVQNLPTRRFRGLPFHYDERGFYIVWPGAAFYKRRNLFGEIRYTGPRGVKPPLLVYEDYLKDIVVIEGELNAISIRRNMHLDCAIASPGAASEFMRHFDKYLKHDKITLVVDNDPAGIANGIITKEALLKAGKRVKLVLRSIDYNELLQQDLELMKQEFLNDLRD